MTWSRVYFLLLTMAACFSAQLFDAPAAQFSREEREFDAERDHAMSFLTDDLTSAVPFANNRLEFSSLRTTANSVFFSSASVGSLNRIDLSGRQSITISGAPGETVTLNLRDFVLGAQSMVSLEGAATTRFVINVQDQFSLTRSGRVVLSGGLQWDDVVFQIVGKGTACRLTKRTRLTGVVVANRRSVLLSGHSIIYGKVMAKRIGIRDWARIITPPVVSP